MCGMTWQVLQFSFPINISFITIVSMGKQKGGKRGRQEHLTGARRTFLDAHASAYTEALDANKPGEFYNFITHEFIAIYGDSIDFTKNTDEEPSNEGTHMNEDGGNSRNEDNGKGGQEEGSPLTREQATKASVDFGNIQKVS